MAVVLTGAALLFSLILRLVEGARVLGALVREALVEIQRARAELLAENHYQADLRRIDQGNRNRRSEAPRVTRIERRSESDDEVRSDLPPNFVALFERVKRGTKALPRMSRTESFLQYAEEHPQKCSPRSTTRRTR